MYDKSKSNNIFLLFQYLDSSSGELLIVSPTKARSTEPSAICTLWKYVILIQAESNEMRQRDLSSSELVEKTRRRVMAPQVKGNQGLAMGGHGQVTGNQGLIKGGLGELIEGRNAILRPALSVTTTTTTAAPPAATERAPDCECVESSKCLAQEGGRSTDFFRTQISPWNFLIPLLSDFCILPVPQITIKNLNICHTPALKGVISGVKEVF